MPGTPMGTRSSTSSSRTRAPPATSSRPSSPPAARAGRTCSTAPARAPPAPSSSAGTRSPASPTRPSRIRRSDRSHSALCFLEARLRASASRFALRERRRRLWVVQAASTGAMRRRAITRNDPASIALNSAASPNLAVRSRHATPGSHTLLHEVGLAAHSPVALCPGCKSLKSLAGEPRRKGIAFSAAAALIIGAAPALADPVADAPARIVASGIPGATAVSQIGSFHPGGPIHDKASFAAFTLPSKILAPTRLFVASSSNFGAPLARPADPEGAILSLDVSGSSLDVPAAFASSGLPASALGGAVQLYSAQSSAFLHSVNNPGAVTSGLPGASLPLGISINDGFGRIWIANAPAGSFGAGTITILDPSGAPLAGAPDHTAGGVFTGDLTNRNASTTHGITAAAVATALVTKSPDGSGRAVFFAALADGSIVQIQTEKGVDGLVPAGTFTPIAGITPDAVESANRGTVTRVGLLFNWVPRPILYVSDPVKNRILAFDITDDGIKFVASAPRYLSARAFDLPVDMAPAVPEVASGNFASNTTFGGGSDLYVLNPGNNTVVRMTQDGRVLAVRAIAPE